MEEAIATSQLEGAATTRRIAREMLENNAKPRNHSERMILNNYQAMQWIVNNKDQTITRERILELHWIITKQTLYSSEEEGMFRQTDDIKVVDTQTGDILHIPPTHQQLSSLIETFCAFANAKKEEHFLLHPILKAIILHFLIGYIHPFADGNGRTARGIFYWWLIQKGYWLVEYMSISRVILASKAQYTRAYQYTELDQNDLTYFLDYNLRSTFKALEELKKYVERKNKEKQNALLLLRQTSYNERQIEIIRQILAGDKTRFTIATIEIAFQVSNQTARNDLNQLVHDGILSPRPSGKKIDYLLTDDGIERIKKISR
jgi:Fic family protein